MSRFTLRPVGFDLNLPLRAPQRLELKDGGCLILQAESGEPLRVGDRELLRLRYDDHVVTGGAEPPPPPVAQTGMSHEIRGSRGRVISVGPSKYWFFGAQFPRLRHPQIAEFFQAPEQRGMQVMWVALSSGHDPKTGQRTFDGRQHRQQVIENLEYLNELGIQPVIEAAMQEFITQELKSDPHAIEDYLEDVGDTMMKGRCKVAFAFREMTDVKWSGIADKTRNDRYGAFNRALRRGVGRETWIGIHLRSGEPPPVRTLRGVSGSTVWLMHFKNKIDPSTRYFDPHLDRWFENGGAWFAAALEDRMEKIPSLEGAIHYENGVTHPGWGPVQTVETLADRARGFLTAPHCLADWAAGQPVPET